MRIAPVIGLLLLTACASPAPYKANIDGETSAPMIDGFKDNEVFVSKPPSTATTTDLSRREGTTESGLPYQYFKDGSGSMGPKGEYGLYSWSIDCKRDKMSDKHECSLTNLDGKLLISYGASKSPTWVCIFAHDFPGRYGQIRVGTAAPITTDKEGCVTAGRVLPQMLGADKVTVRYYKWPYDYTRDAESSTRGLKEAMELVTFIKSKHS